MIGSRNIHPDFQYYLKYKNQELVDLYTDLRGYIFSLFPECNEFLYHTHALTSVYSLSEKLGDAFCMIPIYTNHLNLGFNKGTQLKDNNDLLKGTGKLIRHIPIEKIKDYRNEDVKSLIISAYDYADKNMNSVSSKKSLTISKIKR